MFLSKHFLSYLITLLLAGILLTGCKESSNPVDGDTPFNTTTATITPGSGGTLQVTSKQGDVITLSFPEYAVSEAASVTLQILNETKTNPFSHNLLTTVRILPSGLKLKRPATMKVTFNSPLADTTFTMLYCRKQDDLAYPLEKKTVTNNSIECFVYHFSDYGGAVPTKSEVITQSEKMKSESGVDLWDWQGFYDLIKAMMKYWEMLTMFGETEKADELYDKIEQRIIEQVNAFLDLPVPNEPCGYYLQTLLKYAEMVFMMVSDEQLVERVQGRIGEVINQCNVRGELEFDYEFCFTAEGGTICRTITGFVPFYVNTEVEPYGKIEGSGQLEWNGTAYGVPCQYIEAGVVDVTLNGALELDDEGTAWFDFLIHEHAYGTITVICPNGTQSYPFSPPDTEHEVRMLFENGYIEIRPVPGATSGHFKWVLHLNYPD